MSKSEPSEKHRIFLTGDEALQAVCCDLRQYDPQPLMLRQLASMVWGIDAVIVSRSRSNGLWIAERAGAPLRCIGFTELPAQICKALQSRPGALDFLASICRCVFQEKVRPGIHPRRRTRGLWMETGMEDFVCRQCGQCCRNLDFHKECSPADVAYWRRLGRDDILARVGRTQPPGQAPIYRIWVDPRTREVEKGCPWLRYRPQTNRYECRIHDVRPQICRDYPGSRRHARMTGCPAFEKPPPDRSTR